MQNNMDTNTINASVQKCVHALVSSLTNLETIINLVLEWTQVDLSNQLWLNLGLVVQNWHVCC